MKAKIIEFFRTLDKSAKEGLIDELQHLYDESEYDLLTKHEELLNEKQGMCPHCQNLKYVRNGKKNMVQNYKCKGCKRGFTAYTGTWLAHIHKKELLIPYLKLMNQGYSLDKTKVALKLCKQTVFAWRHKVCSSLDQVEDGNFSGITESDETFFLYSRKGEKEIGRPPRKRGGEVKTRGISKEQVAVIVTRDRKSTMDFSVACLGRISQQDISGSIGEMVNDATVLCSDAHRSFKSFVKEKGLEHHIVNASKKERIKEGKYHIQNVNSTHGRMKKWIDDKLNGVATKYLQNYMNWSHVKEKFKEKEFVKKIIELSTSNILAINNYRLILQRHEEFLKKSLLI